MSELPLLLRIDNVDSLPDGGPVSFELDRRGIDIGRDPYLDWTLPDPDRFISGKHLELRYRDGGYWLHDVSTNGTTINGRGGRLTEPYRLQDGDRIHIGHYIVAVQLKDEDAAPAAPPALSGARPVAGNVWGDVPDAAAAVDRRDFAARTRSGSDPDGPRGPAELPEEDISWGIGALSPDAPAAADPWSAAPAGRDVRDAWDWEPPSAGSADARLPQGPASPGEHSAGAAAEPPPVPQPGQGAPGQHADLRIPGAGAALPEEPASRDPFASEATSPDLASGGASGDAPEVAPKPEDVRPGDASAPADPFAPPAAEGVLPQAFARPGATPPSSMEAGPPTATGLAGQWTGGMPQPTSQPAPQPTQQPALQPAAPADARRPAAGGSFVAAFERGAGLPQGAVATHAEDAFAEELGALFRLVAQHLQAMLLARAETKGAMRSAERTMIGALENNPLKFSPTPEDALRIMFGAGGRSYLDARATIEQSFGDLQRHQVQTFGAMQAALQALIDDLDPGAIEAATPEEGGLAGLVGSRRARHWDTYVERFRAKSGRHERGMIDAFMLSFAEMYDRQG